MATLLEQRQKECRRALRVMQAWLDGKTILCWDKERGHATAFQLHYPTWNWGTYDYEIEGEDDEPETTA